MAVRLYSEIIFNVKLNSDFLRGYRKERKLPDVLIIEEIKFIIDSIKNLKHKTIISLIQKIARHKDIKTTLLYNQISKSQLNKVKNPFDTF